MIPGDLSDAKVYKLTCNGLTYYGSTCQPLAKRLTEHRSKANRVEYNSNRYSSTQLFQQTGHRVTIELVEQVQASTYTDLLARERHYIINNPCVNHKIPLRTVGEYYMDNRERRLAQMKANYYRKKEAKNQPNTGDN